MLPLVVVRLLLVLLVGAVPFADDNENCRLWEDVLSVLSMVFVKCKTLVDAEYPWLRLRVANDDDNDDDDDDDQEEKEEEERETAQSFC